MSSRHAAPAGARGAVRQARRAARAPADGQALAPGHRARRAGSSSTSATCKAINEAADQLERLAEGSRGGKVSRNAVAVSAAAARARARGGRPARLRSRAARARRAPPTAREHDPFGSRVPDHSVVHRYARCLSYPEWGVGTVAGIYFTGDDGRRGRPAVGAREVQPRRPHGARRQHAASSTSPSPTRPSERVERFMIAAQRAMAEGEYELAAQRLIYARDAEPDERRRAAADDARLLAGRQARGGGARGARLGARRRRRARRRTASPRASTRTSARSTSPRRRPSAPPSAAPPTPAPGSGWDACACRCRPRGALEALRGAIALGAGEEVRELIAQALALEPKLAATG